MSFKAWTVRFPFIPFRRSFVTNVFERDSTRMIDSMDWVGDPNEIFNRTGEEGDESAGGSASAAIGRPYFPFVRTPASRSRSSRRVFASSMFHAMVIAEGAGTGRYLFCRQEENGRGPPRPQLPQPGGGNTERGRVPRRPTDSRGGKFKSAAGHRTRDGGPTPEEGLQAPREEISPRESRE